MTEQNSLTNQAAPAKSSPRRIVMIVLAIVGGIFAICICIVVLVGKAFWNAPTVEATEARIGTEIRDDGHLLEENRVISANVEKIYLEFNFGNPANIQVPLEFRWYVENQLLYSFSSIHEDGYVSASITRDPKKLASYPTGNYHVEVWFGNTMILSEPFVVK